MQTLSEIKAMLEARGFSPRKAFGQNFLIDHNLIRRLVDAAGLAPGDAVLEIGPGTGTLTEELLARGCRVVAGEIDRGLCTLLRERFAGAGQSFTLVEGDCLDGKRALAAPLVEAVARLAGPAGTFRLVSNLPYGAGTSVLSILLADYPACVGLFATIQREVADRLTARPGSGDFGPVSVLAQAVGEIEAIAALPPECFWPRPDVTSAMVAVKRRAHPLCADPRRLVDHAQALLSKRRKQLGSLVGRDFPWPPGVTPSMRAEDLGIEQFVAMSERMDPAGR